MTHYNGSDSLKDRNLSLLMDFYELTMANGFLKNNIQDKIAWYDMFFRSVPDNGGYALMAGTEQLAEILDNFRFSEEDISFLRTRLDSNFDENFFSHLKDFKFCCDVYAIREGTPIFPGEPLIVVRGPVFQAQLIETILLLTVNHQSLIATKASRIVRAANGRAIMEFGSRRAQGYDGALYGARAAFIGGCSGTACTLAEKVFGIPATGTMAHSWVQLFDSEIESFRAYAATHPNNCVFLVDTYNTLKSGVPNAITVFKELKQHGYKNCGIRIDSGDITYLSKCARKMLDSEGLEYVKIIASNALDEHIIRDILMQGAAVDSFGVGERLVTSKSEPVFGGVYKLAAVEDQNGNIIPKIKVSENAVKVTNPHAKEVWRLFDRDSGMAMADLVTIKGETVNPPYEIFDPEHTYKRKLIRDFSAKQLLEPLFLNGKRVGKRYNLNEIKQYCNEQLNSIWDEVKRFENPHNYYVDLSQDLYDCKQECLKNSQITT